MRLVALPGQLRWLTSRSSWLSHGCPCAVPDLHEPHAALDQPAGDQNLPGLRARAVHIENVLAARG